MAGSVVVGVLITVSILLTLEKENRPAIGVHSLSKTHWVQIALLISIPIYAFLIPHSPVTHQIAEQSVGRGAAGRVVREVKVSARHRHGVAIGWRWSL